MKKKSYIERITANILIDNNILFKREVYILAKKYRCDFLLSNNKIIEVNGDYWHSNPNIYNINDLNIQQITHLKRYKKKLQYYKENNYQLLEIWESEINNNIEQVKQKILNYATNNN